MLVPCVLEPAPRSGGVGESTGQSCSQASRRAQVWPLQGLLSATSLGRPFWAPSSLLWDTAAGRAACGHSCCPVPCPPGLGESLGEGQCPVHVAILAPGEGAGVLWRGEARTHPLWSHDPRVLLEPPLLSKGREGASGSPLPHGLCALWSCGLSGAAGRQARLVLTGRGSHTFPRQAGPAPARLLTAGRPVSAFQLGSCMVQMGQ